MNRRKGESLDDFRERQTLYKQGWRETRRVLNAAGEIVGREHKTVGRDPKQVPTAGLLTATSTLYGDDGAVRAQWKKENVGDARKQAMWQAVHDGLLARVQPLPERPAALIEEGTPTRLVSFPLGDLHKGLLCWKHDSGGSWDLEISERVVKAVFTDLINRAPLATHALLANMGDYFHYDGHLPLTPTGKNLVDADSRFPKMLRIGMETMRWIVEAIRAKYPTTYVITEPGNHDLSSAVMLMEHLSALYRDDPAVIIDTSPKHFHCVRFGKVMIGTHHGHGPKPQQLPMIFACDHAETWGATTHRYIYEGHVHSQRVYDLPGASVETMRVLPPEDAWAHQKGFRSVQEMRCIVYDPEHGEVSRFISTPGMVGL